jgi:NitT/TauT family transport system substrate-binding protein
VKVRAVLASGLLVFGLHAVAAQDTQTVRLFLTFVPNIQFAPVYVADAQGYFAEEGLNVEWDHGDEPLGIDLIAAGEREFGLISGEQVIAARANARPVVSVFEWFQRYPVGVVFPQERDIAAVSDLAGLNIGIPGRFGASYSGLTAMLSANNLTESDITLTEIGFNAPEVFCLNAVDAAVVYINNEPLQIQQRIDNEECGDVSGVDVFAVSEYADMVSNGIVTSETLIAENPDLVAGFVRAYQRGLNDVIRNPAQAYLDSVPYVESLAPGEALSNALAELVLTQTEYLDLSADASREDIVATRAAMLTTLRDRVEAAELTQFEVLLNTITLWDADILGLSDAESWEITQNILIEMGFIEQPIDVTLAFTNEFLP